LSLRCRDIGTEDLPVEENLAKWLRLAERWGAIIFIEEAEMYLEKRMITDYNGNRLVTGETDSRYKLAAAGSPVLTYVLFVAFYRSIDDFRGLLMLSATRIGCFDDAVLSRIHMIIPYENLGFVQARKIWELFLERSDLTVSSEAMRYVLENEDMVAIKWNGREIRHGNGPSHIHSAWLLTTYTCSVPNGCRSRRVSLLQSVSRDKT
jgi:hypothetical protein